jgi:hypothetical protein
MKKRLIDAGFVVYAAEGEFAEEDAAKVRWLISHIPTIDAVPREEYKRLECELATMKAFMRYMAKDVPNPCQYCKHDVKGGVCAQECYGQGLEHFAFEWKGLPEGVFEKKEEA